MFQVLIVEDNPQFAAALCAALGTSFPFLVLATVDGVGKALDRLSTQVADLVIVDLNLADGSGLDLIRSVRSFSSDPTLVVLTAHDIPEYREAAFAGGANYFLTKGSMDMQDVTAVVELILATRFRALVVADDSSFRSQMAAFLSLAHGRTVVHATHGDDSIAAVVKLKPDLVILRTELGAEHERSCCNLMREAHPAVSPVVISVRTPGAGDQAPCPADFCIPMDALLGERIAEIVQLTSIAVSGADAGRVESAS